MFRKKLYIIGSGGLAKEVYNLFVKDYFYKFIGYLDEDYQKCDKSKNIYYFNNSHLKQKDIAVIAVGDPHIKSKLSHSWQLNLAEFKPLVHQTADLNDCHVGKGSIIFPYVACTVNNFIGEHVTIYQHCSISHDTVIGDYCNITPGVHIAGRCRIGNFVYLGIGCSISNDVSICDNVVVGAGAVVVDSITEPGTYVGVPAKKIK